MRDNPFRQTKIRGYRKVDRDKSYDLLQSLPYSAFWIIMVRVVIIFAMLFLAEYQPDMKGLMDFVYHFIDNLAWFSIGVFLLFYHKTRIGLNFHMHLKTLSQIAFILAGLNIVATLVYGLILTKMHYWQGIYYAFELMLWTVLCLFFFNYWKQHSKRHSRNHSDSSEDKSE